MFRITSKEMVFFNLFDEVILRVNKAANLLEDMLNNYSNIPEKIKKIEELEHECDGYVHDILKQLNLSFITPIDREDIHLISKETDNIVDTIEATAHRFVMFDIKYVREDAKKISNLILQSTVELIEIFKELRNMKKSSILKNKIIEVNRLENQGDNIFRLAMIDLFASEKNPIEIIKWKEIYELLEHCMDACEHIANTVEGVVMKHV